MQLEEMAFETLEVIANVVCLGVFLAMIFAIAVGVN
jgi:hypothetical protein